jgi:hypothetical protein
MSGSFLKDLGERVLRTFVQGAVGTGIPVASLTDWPAAKAAAVTSAGAGLSAVVALITGLLAQRFGHPESASFRGVEADG